MRVILIVLIASVLATAAVSSASGGQQDLNRMSYAQLAKAGDRAIRSGHVYSSRWGDASAWLKSICYEMVERAFRPFGTQEWATFVVNRESGCNPGAINSSSGANGIAQILQSHTQFDHYRMRHDLGYAVAAFVRMSGGGRNTQPWRCC